uniref:SRCR domain-containing protein n=1 Tax=Erpetoichthys calabaricus TaxID=27687 RepID=A0A8C4X2G9_ERPCA
LIWLFYLMIPHALRLIGGTNNCSGRVELQYGDTWGTVCDDDWDLKDVEVVCRQLQCGKAVTAVLEFGGGSGIIWLNKVRCRGSESHLWDCRHEPLGKNDCEHKEDAGVYCSDAEDLRLVNGRQPCEGRVEVLRSGKWGTVCQAGWDEKDTAVVCRQLGCGEALSATFSAYFGEGTGPVLMSFVNCEGQESANVFDCPSSKTSAERCTQRNDVGLVCVRKFLLVNGSSSCSGRVELYFGQQWGTVCDNYWDLQDASVFCNQIGCGYAIGAPGQAKFGEGQGEIWKDNLQCEGNESDLTKCPALDYGQEECTHKNDVGVICSREYFYMICSSK